MSLFKKQAIAIDVSAEPTFFLELSPCMKSISEFNDTIWQSQVIAIKAQQDVQSDLNRVMRLAVETDKGTTTYSMVRAFKNLVSAENMLKSQNGPLFRVWAGLTSPDCGTARARGRRRQGGGKYCPEPQGLTGLG